MVAVSQAPSSEIEVRLRPSAATWRSDQPPKWAELAVIAMPPRQIRRPIRVAAGSSILSGSDELRISSGCSCAPAGGGEHAGAGGATSRQATKERLASERITGCMRAP